jgi:hypothetical protein
MRSVIGAVVAVIIVILMFIIGIFAAPGAALAGFCVMPFAFFFLGWAMRGAGIAFQSPIRATDQPVKAQQRRSPGI